MSYRIQSIWLKKATSNVLPCGSGQQAYLGFDTWGYVNTVADDVFHTQTPSYNSDLGVNVIYNINGLKPGLYAATLKVGWNIFSPSPPITGILSQTIDNGYGFNYFRYGYEGYDYGYHVSTIFSAYPGTDDFPPYGFPSLPIFSAYAAQQTGQAQEVDDYRFEIHYFGGLAQAPKLIRYR